MSAQNCAVRSRKTWGHKQPRGQKNLARGAPGTCPKCPPLIRHWLESVVARITTPLKHCYAIKFRCCKLKKHVATSWTGIYFFQQIFHLLLVLPPSQQILTQQNLRNLVWFVEISIAASRKFSDIDKDGGRTNPHSLHGICWKSSPSNSTSINRYPVTLQSKTATEAVADNLGASSVYIYIY